MPIANIDAVAEDHSSCRPSLQSMHDLLGSKKNLETPLLKEVKPHSNQSHNLYFTTGTSSAV